MNSPVNTRKTSNSPLKQASQGRSRQTVHNILEASEQLISTEGLGALTTNKIAERAGVNIASVYQYFPNKEAIVNTLIQGVFSNETKSISDTIVKLISHHSIYQATHEVISMAITIFRANEALLKPILMDDNRMRYIESNNEFTQQLIQSGQLFLEQRRHELRINNTEHALYVLKYSIIPLLLNYLCNKPMGISDQEMVSEVSDLIACYLLK